MPLVLAFDSVGFFLVKGMVTEQQKRLYMQSRYILLKPLS